MLQQALQLLNWHELLAILAQRNEQLQQAESRATQLQEQLQQHKSETEIQLAAACSQQQAAELKADKVQKESMKQVLVLEVSSQAFDWHEANGSMGAAHLTATAPATKDYEPTANLKHLCLKAYLPLVQ